MSKAWNHKRELSFRFYFQFRGFEIHKEFYAETIRGRLEWAVLRRIFVSPVLRRFFKVREVPVSWGLIRYFVDANGDNSYYTPLDANGDNSYYTPLDEDRLFRLRWIGFVNVVTDHKGNMRHGAVNRGCTASEVRDYWAWHEYTDFPERALPFKVWRAWRRKGARVSCANAVEASGLYPKLECPF